MYICPICKKRLKQSEKSYTCQNRHCFDIAAKGYVNLLTTKGRDPSKAGDDKLMLRSRTDFLDSGAYAPLAERLCELLRRLTSDIRQPCIIDSGCGEGYYTVQFAQALPEAAVYGIELSKNGAAHAASRAKAASCGNVKFAAASAFALPFREGFADVVISVFAPVSNDEYARVLKKGGRLIIVSPTERHLFGLKALLYDEPYENKPNHYSLRCFEPEEEQRLEYTFTLETDKQAADLFAMTPYYYKTSQEAKERLNGCAPLSTEAGFLVQVYRRVI